MAETKTMPTRTENRTMNRTADLIGERGRTSIADVVVSKIAGIAAREIPGVHRIVTQGLSGAVTGFAQRLSGADARGRGVAVEVGQKEAAVDLAVTMDYGVSIAQVADDVRGNIANRIESMTGLKVKEVNIYVADLFFAEDEEEEEEPQARRVQ